MPQRDSIAARIKVAGLALLLVLALTLLPPLILAATTIIPLDWQLLSAVGQSYTGISAILGALAVLAAIYTVRVSLRQADETARTNFRTMQLNLQVLAIQDEDLASAVISGFYDAEPDDALSLRQTVFIAMWLNFYQHGYKSGLMTKESVRVALRLELFKNPLGLSYWRHQRSGWTQEALYDVFNEEYERAAGIA